MRSFRSAAAMLAAVFSVSPSAFSQVEVIESSPTTIRPIGQPRNNVSNAPAATPVQSAQDIQTEMYYQLQTLQQEVATLRGIVEEQSHELSRLKQQRMDDYMDLDRRLSELATGAGNAEPAANTATASASRPSTIAPTVAPSPITASEGEYDSYRNVRGFLSAKQYDQAIAAYNKHLEDYPNGQYTPDVYHWLGQLYQIRSQPEKARDSYLAMINDYPSHPKTPDAKLKLGQLYFQMGDKAKSKELLEEVANSGADESQLAKNFLQDYF